MTDISSFTLTAEDFGTFGHDLNRPECVWIDADGIWCSDGRGGVALVHADKPCTTLGSGIVEANGFSRRKDGSFVVPGLADGKVHVIAPDGTTTVLLDEIGGGSAYSASKAGVINLVKTAAQQLSTSNVRVNAICPGLIETGMTRPAFDHARATGKEHKLGQLNPLRRAGSPEEIANVALFLASAEASYVNGQAWAVDGGLSTSFPVTRQEFGRPAL